MVSLDKTMTQVLSFEWWFLIIKVYKNLAPHGDLIGLIEYSEMKSVERL
jgi:hypothetical protein